MHDFLLLIHLLAATVWTGGHIILSTIILPEVLRERSPQKLIRFESKYEKVGMPALILSAAEVDMAVALSRSTRRKTTLRTAFVEGDSNGDGKLDLPEIYARYDADGRRRGGGEELAMLLMMDGDGDGRVTTEEIMNYVAIFGAKSDQEMREWLTTLLKHWPEE